MSTMERRFGLKGKGLLFLLVFWFFWFSNMTVRVSFAPVLPLIEDEFLVTHARASSIFIFHVDRVRSVDAFFRALRGQIRL